MKKLRKKVSTAAKEVRRKKESKSSNRKEQRRLKSVQAVMPTVEVDWNEFKIVVFRNISVGVIKYGGEFWVSTEVFCRELGLNPTVHRERIRREGYKCRMFKTNDASGDAVDLMCVWVSHIGAWLFNINPGWLKKPCRTKLLIYQLGLQQAVDDFCGTGLYPKPASQSADFDTRLSRLETLAAKLNVEMSEQRDLFDEQGEVLLKFHRLCINLSRSDNLRHEMEAAGLIMPMDINPDTGSTGNLHAGKE